MFAWILNTKPLNAASSTCTVRCRASRACGGGAHSTKLSSISRTPKLASAVPKNTGVRRRPGMVRVEGMAGTAHQFDLVENSS
jgi:hypothetical protein